MGICRCFQGHNDECCTGIMNEGKQTRVIEFRVVCISRQVRAWMNEWIKRSRDQNVFFLLLPRMSNVGHLSMIYFTFMRLFVYFYYVIFIFLLMEFILNRDALNSKTFTQVSYFQAMNYKQTKIGRKSCTKVRDQRIFFYPQ